MENDVLASMTARYVALNRSFANRHVYQFGRGVGFSAEAIGLLKSMVGCLAAGRQLVVGTHPKPSGFGLGEGWGDYFANPFPTTRSRPLHLLNRHLYPGHSRLPRWLIRVAHSTTRNLFRAQSMQFDPLPLPERLVVPQLGIDLGWWDACRFCLDIMWQRRPEVAARVADIHRTFDIREPYIGVHLRRGDKVSESSYVALNAYSAAIHALEGTTTRVLIASDDASEANMLATMLRPRFDTRVLSSPEDHGYDQALFNGLPGEQRRQRTIRFIAEFEALRDAETTVVTTTSNVGCLLQYARSNHRLVSVDPPPPD